MKNPLYYLLTLLFMFTSCKQPNEENVVIETALESELINVQNDCTNAWNPETNNCFCSKQIFSETAFMWQASWVSYFNYNFNINKEGRTYAISPSFNFPLHLIKTLFNEVENSQNSGLLISYIINNPNSGDPLIPGLAIQNIVNCEVDPKSSIFVSFFTDKTFTGGDLQGNITSIELEKLKSNWLKANKSNVNVYTIAEGYMYSWDSLNSINATTEGITISYGLRTLEPGEETGFKQQGDSDGRTGSIVYCNIIYGGQSVTKTQGYSEMLLDFARPCPVYCHD